MSTVGARARAASRGRQVERAGRAGLVAKGFLYLILGGLAIKIPLGLGGAPQDRDGALRTVAQQPLGEALLLALAAGLAGYAVWRLAEGIFDRDGEGTSAKALAKRAGRLGKGVVYGAAAFAAFAVVAGIGAAGGNEREDTARLLELPLGRWIVAGVGVGFLAAGAYNAYRSLTQRFRKHLREYELSDGVRTWAIAVGVAGHAARGVVFALVGVFFVRAAVAYDPREAIGLDGALLVLAQQPYGRFLLAAVAAGLLCYALYCFVQARYRRV